MELETGQESGDGTLGGDDLSSLSSTPATFISRWTFSVWRRYQHILDKSVPYVLYRWIGFVVVAIIYALRVYFAQGFYIITYGLCLYLLMLLIGFLSPQVDMKNQRQDGTILPTRASDEFRPFVRRIPEFKFWYAITVVTCVAFLMTFFRVFDFPAFWPMLLFYWVFLFCLTMKKRIRHMMKYKYVPFTVGKQRYDGKKARSTGGTVLPRD